MSSRKQVVRWGSPGARSPSPSPRRSPSPSPRRSSTPVRSSTSQNSRFSPRTTSELQAREAKVNRRRLQAEAKAHKFAMQQQRQETRHAKRSQDLEYAMQHKELYGVSPTTKYGIMAVIAGVIGFVAFQQI